MLSQPLTRTACLASTVMLGHEITKGAYDTPVVP